MNIVLAVKTVVNEKIDLAQPAQKLVEASRARAFDISPSVSKLITNGQTDLLVPSMFVAAGDQCSKGGQLR